VSTEAVQAETPPAQADDLGITTEPVEIRSIARSAIIGQTRPLSAPPTMAEMRDGHLGRVLRLADRREPLVAEIANWVGIGIVEGQLGPGQDLNSVELAKRFSTSRTPVREALMLLEQEGLVEMKARRRPRVALVPLDEVREIYGIRSELLAMVASLVVEHASDADLEMLGLYLEALRASVSNNDLDRYFWTHVALQERYTEVSENRTLKQILDSLAIRTLVLRHRSLTKTDRLSASLADQESLYAAMVRRDADLASAMIKGATRAALHAIEDTWS
jgi:DNA-binding GntR family transcriptional regulator